MARFKDKIYAPRNKKEIEEEEARLAKEAPKHEAMRKQAQKAAKGSSVKGSKKK